MAGAKWEKAVITTIEDVNIVSSIPMVKTYKYYVDIYENAEAEREAMPLIRIECESAEAAGAVKEVLVENQVDFETFTSLSDL